MLRKQFSREGAVTPMSLEWQIFARFSLLWVLVEAVLERVDDRNGNFRRNNPYNKLISLRFHHTVRILYSRTLVNCSYGPIFF